MKDFFDGYDERPVDPGFKSEPLKADDYVMTFERIIRSGVSANGSVYFSGLFRVSEGPYAKRTALIQQYITGAVQETVMDGENAVRVDGVVQRRMRPDEDYDKANSGAINRTRGLVFAFTGDASARDTIHDAPTDRMPTDEDVQYYLDRMGINDCVGKDALVTLTLDREGRNGASRFKNTSDQKAMGEYRNKTLLRQIERHQRENPSTLATPSL